MIERVLPYIHEEYQIIPEPVEEWEKSGVLARSYTDPSFIFPAQCEFFTSRVRQFRNCYNPETINFSERSPFSDVLFWNVQSVDKLLHSTYLNMWSEWQNLMPVRKPDLFIYLNTSVDLCMRRMRERNRSAEDSVSKEYQMKLKRQHDTYLLDPKGVKMPDGSRVPCVVIDTTENYRDDSSVARLVAERVSAFLK